MTANTTPPKPAPSPSLDWATPTSVAAPVRNASARIASAQAKQKTIGNAAKPALPATVPLAHDTDVEDDVTQDGMEATKHDAQTQEKPESSLASDPPSVVLAQNAGESTSAAAISGVANIAVGEALSVAEEEQVAALVIPPAAGISGTTMAAAGVGGLALAGGGGGDRKSVV